jgi:hypothetical protein
LLGVYPYAKILLYILVGPTCSRGWVRTKPHLDAEVTKGYLEALEKLVPDREECAAVRLEIGRYFSGTGLYGNFHAMDDKDKFDSLTWWETYGGHGLLPKLAKKVLSQVVNSSSAERCWSTYSYIHNVKRNRLNENRAESLVYVHYNLRLLSHYCDRSRRFLKICASRSRRFLKICASRSPLPLPLPTTLVWKVFCKLLWMLSPLFFLCSKGKLWGITIGLEEWL